MGVKGNDGLKVKGMSRGSVFVDWGGRKRSLVLLLKFSIVASVSSSKTIIPCLSMVTG